MASDGGAAPSKPPVVRKKVKTGCITCRIRKVKCDEQKPACHRCVSTGRKCDGYGTIDRRKSSPSRAPNAGPLVPAPRPQLNLLPLSAWEDDRERRYFEFFCLRTAPELSKTSDTRFWSYLVPQASQFEVAVRHAMVALASFHESHHNQISSPGSSPQAITTRPPLQEYAFNQYQKAVSQLYRRISTEEQDNTQLALVTGILLFCFDTFQGDLQSALIHLHNGVKIANNWADGRTSNRDILPVSELRNVQAPLSEMFARLCVQISGSLEKDRRHLTLALPLDETDTFQGSFTNLEDVRKHLYDLTIPMLRLLQTAMGVSEDSPSLDEVAAPIREKHTELKSKFDHLSGGFQTFLRAHGANLKGGDLHTAALLQLHYTTASIVLDTIMMFGDEMVYDVVEDDFRGIVSLSQKILSTLESNETSSSSTWEPTLSLEMGVIAPLYFAAIKCRHPVVRREALEMLRSMRRREGAWESQSCAVFAQEIIEREEQGLENVQTSADVPASSRLGEVKGPELFIEDPVQLLQGPV